MSDVGRALSKSVHWMPCCVDGGNVVSLSTRWSPHRINVCPMVAVSSPCHVVSIMVVSYCCRPIDGRIVSMYVLSMSVRWRPCCVDGGHVISLFDPMMATLYICISGGECVLSMPCCADGGRVVLLSTQRWPHRINVSPMVAVSYRRRFAEDHVVLTVVMSYRCRPNNCHIVLMYVRWWLCHIDVGPLKAMLFRPYHVISMSIRCWPHRNYTSPILNMSHRCRYDGAHIVSI